MFTLKTKGLSELVALKNLPTLRQAFVVASAIIIVAFVLANIMHPNFIYLAMLPAFGLLFSGLTGFCPMIFLLQLLPGNEAKSSDLP
jgi:hypothetical protein